MSKPKSLKETLKKFAVSATKGISGLIKDKKKQVDELVNSLKIMRAMDDKGKMRQILDSSETLKKYFHKNEDDKKTFKRGGLTGIMLMQLHDYLQKPYGTLDEGEKALKEKPNWLKCDDAIKLKTELKKQLPVNWTKSVLYDKNVLQALAKINEKIIEIENEKYEQLRKKDAENKKSQSALSKKTPPPVPARPNTDNSSAPPMRTPPPIPARPNTDNSSAPPMRTPPPIPARPNTDNSSAPTNKSSLPETSVDTIKKIIKTISDEADKFEDKSNIETIKGNITLMEKYLCSPGFLHVLNNNFKRICEDLNRCAKQKTPYEMNKHILIVLHNINTRKKLGKEFPRPAIPIPSGPTSTPSPTATQAAAKTGSGGRPLPNPPKKNGINQTPGSIPAAKLDNVSGNENPTAPPAPPPPKQRSASAPPATGTQENSEGANFLNQIKNGDVTLKKVPERPASAPPTEQPENDLTSMLKKAMAGRRFAVADDDDDDDAWQD